MGVLLRRHSIALGQPPRPRMEHGLAIFPSQAEEQAIRRGAVRLDEEEHSAISTAIDPHRWSGQHPAGGIAETEQTIVFCGRWLVRAMSC